jgi:hypothetical protein
MIYDAVWIMNRRDKREKKNPTPLLVYPYTLKTV